MSEKSICKLVSAARTIYLSGPITQNSAFKFRLYLSRLSRIDPELLIDVEVNSSGGDMDAAFLIVDTIRSSSTPVRTTVTGCAMSAAALILAAGKHRQALPTATVMVHQGSFSFSGTFTDVMNEVSVIRRAEELYSRLIEKYSNQPRGFWEEKWKEADFYMDAKSARAYGLVDTILGEEHL